MKFRRLFVIILVAALLAVYYIYGTDYRERHNNNAALASQIAGATQQRAQITSPPADLEQRQAAASVSLDTEKNAFPAQLNSTRIVNAILQLAEATGIKAIPMVTQPWTTESVNETNYPVFRLNIAAKGTYVQLADFINRLENGEPATLVIGDLTVVRVTGLSSGKTGAGDTMAVDATLNIAIYGRPFFAEQTLKVDNK
jgi:Tfp pilus assembly protein PilO